MEASTLLVSSVDLRSSTPILFRDFSVTRLCSLSWKVLVAPVMLESRLVFLEPFFQSPPKPRACLDFCPITPGFYYGLTRLLLFATRGTYAYVQRILLLCF